MVTRNKLEIILTRSLDKHWINNRSSTTGHSYRISRKKLELMELSSINEASLLSLSSMVHTATLD